MVIAHSVAKALNWSAELISSMDMASLTMNASMRVLQDSLAAGTPLITGKVRAEINGHAVASAELLAACGATDAVCPMDIVRLHHDDSRREELPLPELGDAQRAARVLRRVDQFAAKLSRRATRAPMSPVKAAREACVGADGAPDEIGAALLGAVGLYPPGSCVELVATRSAWLWPAASAPTNPRWVCSSWATGPRWACRCCATVTTSAMPCAVH